MNEHEHHEQPAEYPQPFRVERSVSWGDIIMFLTGAVGIIVVAVQLQAQVDQLSKDIHRIELQASQNALDLRSLEQSEAARRQELRLEMRGDLNEINRKLDRLIERDARK